MKLGVQISLLILLFHFTGMSIASNNNFSNTILINTSISIVDNSWTLVKTENGINVYLSNYTGDDGSLKLDIKFENTLNKDVKAYWSLKKSSVQFFQKVELIIKALGIYEVDKTTMMVPFNDSDSIEDFEIIFE